MNMKHRGNTNSNLTAEKFYNNRVMLNTIQGNKMTSRDSDLAGHRRNLNQTLVGEGPYKNQKQVLPSIQTNHRYKES